MLLAVALVSVVGVVVLAASERRTLAFTLGVAPTGAAATLQPGQEACQQPVLVEAAFDAVELQLDASGSPLPHLAVAVRPFGGTSTIARGALSAHTTDGIRPAVARVGQVPAGRTVAICVRNVGAGAVALGGGPDAAALGGSAALDGTPTGNDLALVLRTTDSHSTLALLPDMFKRAALFRGSWIGPWLYWTLLTAIVLAVPALLVQALASTASNESA